MIDRFSLPAVGLVTQRNQSEKCYDVKSKQRNRKRKVMKRKQKGEEEKMKAIRLEYVASENDVRLRNRGM